MNLTLATRMHGKYELPVSTAARSPATIQADCRACTAMCSSKIAVAVAEVLDSEPENIMAGPEKLVHMARGCEQIYGGKQQLPIQERIQSKE
jgi:hypothetical protein